MEKKISFEKATLILLISQKPKAIKKILMKVNPSKCTQVGWEFNFHFSSDNEKSRRNQSSTQQLISFKIFNDNEGLKDIPCVG